MDGGSCSSVRPHGACSHADPAGSGAGCCLRYCLGAPADFLVFGDCKLRENYPLADWKELGVRFALSTDSPATSWATPSEPFANLKGAVTRKAWNGHECGQRHKLDIRTAIELYTREAAPLVGFTDVGRGEEGDSADVHGLDRDVLESPCEEIDHVKVDATWIGGEKVFQR